ncbi:hypothetical protein ONS95_008662 [Cadophora gregata]|uniref:uncharacterized protein n=1 Tax=Cadophora gregata TaxID=51156 RepID=UPI0026DD23BA|nr:uncharacterized protein ONS95_008662 [Cadophora gregata]KAK0123650.1 hypothetical protein ONS95_008662 [Cadophora gregata]KAK0129992.1 hypothetical protein ONS96_000530 [Cadophora gregata f. sp. sojae]
MKLTSALCLAFATIISAKFSMTASFTDALVDLGDLDTFWSVWNRMYDMSDSRGGLSDVTREVFNWNCNSDHQKPQISTRVILDGQWGAVGRVNGWQMRDALIKSMWRTVEVAGQQQSYPVYNHCSGFTWQESVPGNSGAACGPRARVLCPSNGRCRGAGPLECQGFQWGHKIPSIVRINVYNDNGSLRADAYQARFSSESNSNGGGGCGKAGAIAETLASFIPGVGVYFDKGIKIACRQGGLP